MLSKTPANQTRSTRYYLFGILMALVLFGGYQLWRYYSRPPRLQASAEATKTLDALFTALTSRDSAQLAACMERIETHFSAGKLGYNATAELRYCNELANAGSWEQAAKRLYWVVYEQPAGE
jgi:predicted negative regulator of RcsB-dependent stress response